MYCACVCTSCEYKGEQQSQRNLKSIRKFYLAELRIELFVLFENIIHDRLGELDHGHFDLLNAELCFCAYGSVCVYIQRSAMTNETGEANTNYPERVRVCGEFSGLNTV